MCKMKCDLSEIDLKIIAVSNRKLCERPFLEQIERVCQMKPQAIILREKDLSEEEYRILSEEVLSVCKKGLAPRGLGFLKDVCSTVNVPVYAIGGIKFDEKQWEELKQNGASGGCIMSGMMEL